MPSWSSLGFQDSSSLSMMELIILHDYVMVVMTSVLLTILYLMAMMVLSNKTYKTFSESTLVETIWSVIPAIMLIFLVLPSMKVLYMVEDLKNPLVSFKIIAHQWYWSIISPTFMNLYLKNNKYMITNMEQDMIMLTKTPRLLSCSSNLFTPINTPTRLLITSTDVIHSFSIPSLGLKVDALPGRINQLYTNPMKMGMYYGQCSEICGSNHSFMPFTMTICSDKMYNKTSMVKTLEYSN